MKPQGFGQMGGGNLEDLGWNDMGFEPPKPAEAPRDATHDAFGEDVVDHPRAHPSGLTPVGSPVHSQQAEIADRLSADEPDEADEIEEVDEVDEEFDETAELYEPEEEAVAAVTPAPEPVVTPASELIVASAPVVVARRAPTPAAKGRRRSRCASIRRGISSCASPVPSTDARRSKSSPMRSTGCSRICRNSTPWPKRPNARGN
jgi:hypothetical protein